MMSALEEGRSLQMNNEIDKYIVYIYIVCIQSYSPVEATKWSQTVTVLMDGGTTGPALELEQLATLVCQGLFLLDK